MFKKTVKNKSYLFFIVSLLCMPFMAHTAPNKTIKIAVTQRLANLYQSIIEREQKQIITFTDVDLKNTTKGFVSLVILKQALHKAGLATKFEFVISPNYKRSQLLVQSGDALFTLATLLEDHTPPDTLKSSILINSQDMARGIYGLKSNHKLMNVKSLDELKKMSAVTNIAWGGRYSGTSSNRTR
jgi:hypothetical protein